ncbi:hypothetical protein TD95_000693 [Thielaviopsis punctulata]|uniref:Amine oxidase domain-containing protein n=1 Tax=Thielaviopsis punctulata TaxID=72032 RepID=A0A0F4ZHI1_9PEZI|nr:hypothetical protein TD95_000693 [Thielaviopsis punctulata]
MDTHSVSYNDSVEKRAASRIYQDLYLFQARFPASPTYSDLCSTRSSSTMSNSLAIPHHIGIIGAGFSGLRCADVLLSHGFRVTIIEGRSRIGGRVHQATLRNGFPVDMGANWVHGTTDNPVYEIAKATGTACSGWDATQLVCDAEGVPLETGEREELADLMWTIVLDAFAHSNKNSASIDPKESLYDWFTQQVPKRIPESVDGWMRKREIVLQMADSWGTFIGSPVESQSLKFFWLEECVEGGEYCAQLRLENLFCEGTHRKVLEAIASHALEKAEIIYETIAHKIKYRSRESSSHEAVYVQCSSHETSLHDGSRIKVERTFEFDDVVVTTPLGWLKNNRDAFEPELPPRLCKAIDSISFGCLEKVYMTFETPFWRKEPQNSSSLSIQGFSQWLSPRYTATNPEHWSQELVELASLSAGNAHNTLLFYIFGDQSVYITSTISSLHSHKERTDFLTDHFRPYLNTMPGYNASSPACAVVDCLASNWLNDELAGNGSYANFQVGLEEGDRDIEVMREGIPDRGLWLAGEHTAPFVALGTTTGAYWSGEAVGRRIAEKYEVGV